MIRVVLPAHLRALSRSGSEVQLEVKSPVTASSILDALETKYPQLQGTIRDHGTLKRRGMVRFYVCQEDWSHESVDKPLPQEISSGKEPFLIIGAVAGG